MPQERQRNHHTKVGATLVVHGPCSDSYVKVKDMTSTLDELDVLPERLWSDDETCRKVAIRCAEGYTGHKLGDDADVGLSFDPEQETTYVDYVLERKRREPELTVTGPTDITTDEILACLRSGAFAICDRHGEIACAARGGSELVDDLWFYFAGPEGDELDLETYVRKYDEVDCARRIADTLKSLRRDDALMNEEWQSYRDIVSRATSKA